MLTDTPQKPTTESPTPLRIAHHAIGSRVRILVGGFRQDCGTVSDVRNGLHFLNMDSGITLGGYTAWQLEAVER